MYIQNVFTKEVVSMAKTQAVNFRADSVFYQKTKDILADEKITVSDVLNAALRKIANRTVDAREFVSVIFRLHSIKWLLRI